MSIKIFHHKIPIEEININHHFKNKFLKFGGAVLLLWANTLSPFGINRQKRRLCEPFRNFLPIGISK